MQSDKEARKNTLLNHQYDPLNIHPAPSELRTSFKAMIKIPLWLNIRN